MPRPPNDCDIGLLAIACFFGLFGFIVFSGCIVTTGFNWGTGFVDMPLDVGIMLNDLGKSCGIFLGGLVKSMHVFFGCGEAEAVADFRFISADLRGFV